MFISTKNIFYDKSFIIKVTIKNQIVERWIHTEIAKSVIVVGSYDLNDDNQPDVLYLDGNKNVRINFF